MNGRQEERQVQNEEINSSIISLVATKGVCVTDPHTQYTPNTHTTTMVAGNDAEISGDEIRGHLTAAHLTFCLFQPDGKYRERYSWRPQLSRAPPTPPAVPSLPQ